MEWQVVLTKAIAVVYIFASMIFGQTASMPDTVAFVGGDVSIPVIINDIVDLEGLEFTVEFDESILTATSITFDNTELDDINYNVSVGLDNVGEIIVAVFATGPIYSGSGTILFIGFDVIGVLSESTDLAFTSIEINNISILESSHNGSVTLINTGCTDIEACNYSENADIDDGSCEYESDCLGECGGSAMVDDCGVCDGDNLSCADCTGIPNGLAYIDNCDICDDDPSNDCIQDCLGEWGGSAVEDECDVCNGDNSTCLDCNGEPNGDSELDMCGNCDTDLSNDCIQDCNGDWGGTAIIDECEVCDGNNSTCMDCAEIPNGDSLVDECGVCGGDGLIPYYADWDNDGFGDCDAILYHHCEVNAEPWMTVECGDCDDQNINAILYDDCGVCGGSGVDEDEDNICDDADTCIEEVGISQECGCNMGIAEGACDCEGNIFDECGICNGPGIPEGACDCSGSLPEENHDCNGDELLINNSLTLVEFKLLPNFPNPFNPTTTINYSVDTFSAIELSIYSMSGRIIQRLVDSSQQPGRYAIQWDASNSPSGLYFVKLISEDRIAEQKILLIK